MRRSMTLGLSLLGLFDSLYLLYTYTSPSRPMVCIGTGCDAVRASAYSTLGGVSMPLFGVLGYTLLAPSSYAECLVSKRSARLARYAFLGMTGFGFLFSLYLEYLQAFVIHAYCAWCVTSGAVMTVLFGLAIVNVVRSRPGTGTSSTARAGAESFRGIRYRRGGVRPGFLPARAPWRSRPRCRPGHGGGNGGAVGASRQPRGRQSPSAIDRSRIRGFECPVCGRGEAVARETRARYTREVRFLFRQFPLERIHPFAKKAAEASECAGEQGKFWDMVEKIYSRQEDLSTQGLVRDAVELGLDQARFNQCLSSGAMAERVGRDMADGRALGVRATPTFFIGQQKIEGVLTAAQLSQLIDEQLAGAGLVAARNAETSASPAPTVVKKPLADRPMSPTLPKVPAVNAPAAAGRNASTADPGRPLIGFPPPALGGVAARWQGSPSPGLFGSAGGGTTCSEADAAKVQPTLIGTEELRHVLTGNAKPLFVDVRPASDYAAGRIFGAINMPADEIGRRWTTLPKDRTIILYEGGRSSGDVCAASRAAGRTLLEHGFPFAQIKVYQDGFAGWEKAGIGMDQ